MGGCPPFAVLVSPEHLHSLHTYREPQLRDGDGERPQSCTRSTLSRAYSNPSGYDLSSVVVTAIGGKEFHWMLALRYQLNPYRVHYLQPRRSCDVIVYESAHLREVFVETVPLQCGATGFEWSDADALHGVCGVNVYTRAEGVFSPPGTRVPVGKGNNASLVLIYSTIPSVRAELQCSFDAKPQSPWLIVEDAFIEWGTLGWLSLNELQEMGVLRSEDVGNDLFDLVLCV
ncbi:uncharacterized protein TM35_000152220 [Trypanosoma theileri]|uniref:Uncharacterized protein n=1 Tax=Trypanosoma theileri TaxID=67003 RepID=A0A1X0NVZ9_9TRYP|nr:uncharacterized protein TM35_000152220 [Trypanosoma theileri]ORC88791.1 hypothetical protein TM35_000152220 [Trypanosoma theileri]